MAFETRLGAGIRQLGDTDNYRMLRGKDLDITEATALTSLADTDIFLVDDNAQGTQASTKKTTALTLKDYILPTIGIANGNILSANANVSDNDFLKIDGTSVEGRDASEVKSDLSLNNVENKSSSTIRSEITASDIPNISTGKLTSGTLPVVRGGTGLSDISSNAGKFLKVNTNSDGFELADGGGTVSDINDIGNVSTSGVGENFILVYNGTSFTVQSMQSMISNPTQFTFSLTSFTDNETGPVLIGSGVWKTQASSYDTSNNNQINFQASYAASPPDSAMIKIDSNGNGSYSNLNSMISPQFTKGFNSTDINYPSNRDSFIRFTLTVVKNSVSTTHGGTTRIYFRNNIYFGANSATSLDANGIKNLENTELLTSNTNYRSNRSITVPADNYIYIAFPSDYADINNNGFIYNNLTCPFEDKAIVSIQNSNGFTENYDVYRSTSKDALGNSTLKLSTSDTTINNIFCGTTNSSNPSDLSDFTASQTIASNDITRNWNELTAGSGKHVMFAWPANSRIDTASGTTSQTPTFTVGVLPGGFRASNNGDTFVYTNPNGFQENYKIFVSNQAGLGTLTVTTS